MKPSQYRNDIFYYGIRVKKCMLDIAQNYVIFVFSDYDDVGASVLCVTSSALQFGSDSYGSDR